ncbi:MAG: glycosyltransferase [Chloroflexi bacterium]|nr:glycosyltransferase [Chloroflexota bacterium]
MIPLSVAMVSLIVPTLNEAENIRHVFPLLPRLPELVEVLVVDGHSTDGTAEIAQAIYPETRVVYQEGRGKSDAIRCGVQAATSEFVLIMDADGSHDPREIPRFVSLAKAGYDLVKGSRYIPGGHSDDESRLRRLLVWVTDATANLLWGSYFTDIVFGMFLIRRRSFLDMRLTSQGFALETQLMARAKRLGYRTIEIPMVEAARRSGSSHLSVVKDGWYIGSTVFLEFFHRLTRDWLSGVASSPPSRTQRPPREP